MTEREGVALTHLDQPVFDGAEATKRDLVDYLDAVSDRLIPVLRDRALSVIRARQGQAPFMQKNLPRYAPGWISTVSVWAASSAREISYPLCNDRRTLLWLANQRAVEYHPALVVAQRTDQPTHLVLDLDPPSDLVPRLGFDRAVAAAKLIRQTLSDAGLVGAVKTSGAKGVHVFVPLCPIGPDGVAGCPPEDVAAATRALAARAERLDPDLATTAFLRADRGGRVYLDPTRSGGATVVAAYSPRARAGLPVSFPLAWSDLDQVTPADFTVRTAPSLLADRDPWRDTMPEPATLPPDLIAEGHQIPIPRVQAMHEGKRRARAKRSAEPKE
ncbi:MAG TPA: ATP-dependent DNA ligase [Pseudonocardia sp.]|nr:ATP-dependent DNA ligase [Pseudonocardia sp.]